MTQKQKIYLTYPTEKIKEPILCKMYDTVKVRFNIRSASVNEQVGIMALELEAESEDKLNEAVRFFKESGVTVEPIELDVVAG